MRAARKASLLVAFYLLTSAVTAYAEYTWMLWNAVNFLSVNTERGWANDGCLSDPRFLSGKFSDYSRWLYGENAEHRKHCEGSRRRNCSVRKGSSANNAKVYLSP